MWPFYDLEGIYNKTDSATKNSLVFPSLSTTKLTTVYNFMFKILGFLKMTITLAYVLEPYRVQFLRFKKQHHAICSFLGFNHFLLLWSNTLTEAT